MVQPIAHITPTPAMAEAHELLQSIVRSLSVQAQVSRIVVIGGRLPGALLANDPAVGALLDTLPPAIRAINLQISDMGVVVARLLLIVVPMQARLLSRPASRAEFLFSSRGQCAASPAPRGARSVLAPLSKRRMFPSTSRHCNKSAILQFASRLPSYLCFRQYPDDGTSIHSQREIIVSTVTARSWLARHTVA